MVPRAEKKKKRKDLASDISQHIDDPIVDALNTFITVFMEKYSLSFQDVVAQLNNKRTKQDVLSVPVEIFQERKLGILEILIKYLKEEKNFRYNQIAKLLNRDERTVWVSYHNALHKRKVRFNVSDSSYWIPVSIFSNRALGTLQTIVTYLKEKFSLSYHEIGVLLHRDDRIIWATYNKNGQRKKV